jgi:hypothetical protein
MLKFGDLLAGCGEFSRDNCGLRSSSLEERTSAAKAVKRQASLWHG